MPGAQYRLSWDTYKSNICDGFARFQQNEEFVDMTLAADGHLVKVHRNLIALASPYIKSMLQSAVCQHPVVFLHNISHKVLYYLLEYIYTGEAQVPYDMINLFIEAAKALSIKGVESILPPMMPQQNVPVDCASSSEPERYPSNQQIEPTQVPQPTEQLPKSNFAAHITINTNDYNLEVHPLVNNDIENTLMESNGLDDEMQDNQADPIYKDIVQSIQNMPVIISENDNTHIGIPQIGQNLDNVKDQILDDCADITITQEPSDLSSSVKEISNLDVNDINLEKLIKTELKPQYTISNRGALQLTLNRYLYYCHHQSYGGRKRRWRCVDYRKLHCKALIDMDGETIISRIGIHSHPYHDFKIHEKQKRELLFTSATDAEEARAQETKDTYVTVSYDDADMGG